MPRYFLIFGMSAKLALPPLESRVAAPARPTPPSVIDPTKLLIANVVDVKP
ncbi:hypothetical protein QWJ17_02535 [Betaproteobacteria bacterium LSUCC0117]|nr:hypothetical protein [Betaproteobacteria bacterium LSUCC0117]